MKKIFLLLMVVTILTTSSFAQTFSDLPEGHWAKGSVEEMVKAGIISGYTDGTFRPSAELSKIHSLLLLARIAGINENTSAATKYASTYSSKLSKYSTQYKTDIAYLLGTGVLNESDLDDLLADDKINTGLTREEMAILVTKVLGKEKEATSKSLIILSFDDASSISAKAKPYVYYVSSNGYMNGVDSENFAPKMILTRAQAASVFQRIYKLANITPSNNDTTNSNTTTSTQASSILTGTITNINSSTKIVKIKDSNGNTKECSYDSSTEFYANSKKKTSDVMAKNAQVTVTLTKDNYITVMNISEGANITTGTISGTITSVNTSKKTVTIKKSSKTYTYEYDTNTKFTLDGKSSTATKALVKNREITVTIEDGEYISVAKVSIPEESIIGKIVDADDDEGYIIIEDEAGNEYIIIDDYLDEYSDDDDDYYFDDDTDFYYNNSSKSYSSISSTSYLYNESYYVKIILDDDYIDKLYVASSKSKFNKDIKEIIGKIADADDDEGYIIIEEDDGNEYIIIDDYLDEYRDDDDDYYFDDDTDFYYNDSSKSYSSISSTSYLYNESYYVKIILDGDYVDELYVASSKSKLISAINTGFIHGYITDWDEDYIEIKDVDEEDYSFNIGSDCVIIKRSSEDPESDLYYYDNKYGDILDEDDHVVIFVYDEEDDEYYTSLIILLD